MFLTFKKQCHFKVKQADSYFKNTSVISVCRRLYTHVYSLVLLLKFLEICPRIFLNFGLEYMQVLHYSLRNFLEPLQQYI